MTRLAQLGRLVAGLLIGLGAATAASAQSAAPFDAAKPMRVAIPGNVFANLNKANPVGVFVETLDAVLKGMGVTPNYVKMPTGDALRRLNDGTVGVASVVVLTPRVRETAYFSDPIITEYNVPVTLKGKGFPVALVSDLNGKTVGGRTGYRYPLLENDSGVRLERYRTDGEMLRALLFGKIDVAIIAGISDVYQFRSEGILKRMEILKKAVGAVPLVAVFSKKKFSKEQVDAFNQALAAFKQGPEWQQILEHNGMEDLVKDWPLVKP
jgi:ABC-type amino acid transport substrate-binding protein